MVRSTEVNEAAASSCDVQRWDHFMKLRMCKVKAVFIVNAETNCNLQLAIPKFWNHWKGHYAL
jgi:hypothetical protein